MTGSELRVADLEPAVQRCLRTASRLGVRSGARVYLVGGLVRDALLGRSSNDLDLVLLGELQPFLELLSRALGRAARIEPRLSTAAFDTEDGLRIDVVRARAEVYERRGGRPTVRPGTLHEDLFRRDFTVNAMALWSGRSERGVCDPFGGRRDLSAGLLRVLHDGSFDDDASRILRGLRLSSTHALSFEDRTLELATRSVAAGALSRVGKGRLADELRRFLAVAGEATLTICEEIDLGRGLEGLSFDAAARNRFLRLVGRPEWTGLDERQRFVTQLAILSWRASKEERGELAAVLGLQGAVSRLLADLPGAVDTAVRAWSEIDSRRERFEAARKLGRVGRALAAAVAAGPFRVFLATRWPELAGSRLTITGADLLAAGFAPGEAIGAALVATRRARIERRIEADAEMEFALACLDAAGGGAEVDPEAGAPPGRPVRRDGTGGPGRSKRRNG